MPTLLRSFSNVVGLNGSPFDLGHRGAVRVVGAVRARMSLDGMLSNSVRHDGSSASSRLLKSIGTLERRDATWVQDVGVYMREAGELLAATTSHGNIPEPVRLAHIIAGGVERSVSCGRP